MQGFEDIGNTCYLNQARGAELRKSETNALENAVGGVFCLMH
jgi:hypothetical protein